MDFHQLAGELRGRDEEGHDADRHVDVEDPTPRQVLHEESAQEWTEHGGDAEGRPEKALVATALAGRDDVTHDGQGTNDESTGPQALDGPEADQLEQRVAETRERRADQEDHDGRLKERLASVLVAELAPQRRRDSGGQQICGHHPGQMGCPMEVSDDGGQRGRNDGLIESGEEQSEEERADDEQHPPSGQVESRCDRRGAHFRSSRPTHRPLGPGGSNARCGCLESELPGSLLLDAGQRVRLPAPQSERGARS